MAVPKNSSVQKIQMRLKSSSEISQRTWTHRELSSTSAMSSPGRTKPVSQPQKRRLAPRRKGGVFICLSSSELSQVLLNSAKLQYAELARVIAHRAGLERGAAGFRDHQHQQRDIEAFDFFHKLPPRFVPGQEHTKAAADRRDMIEHQMLQRCKWLVVAGTDRRQNLQHLLRVGQAPAGSEPVGLRADE